MDSKTVAVVMCTYNGGKYLREQMDSILSQTHPADEIIVQDDGSTDNTVGIIREYQGKCSRIRLFRNETRQGINDNFYSAMERTACDYIAIADQDDIWANDKIERQLSAIGDKMLCIGKDQDFRADIGDSSGDDRQQNFSLLRLLFCSAAGGHTFLLSKRMLAFLPLMRGCPRMYDVPIHIIAAAYDSVALVLPRPTQFHRIHSSSAVYSKRVNNKKTLGNAVSYMVQCWRYYRELRPEIVCRMKEFHSLLSQLDAKTKSLADAMRMTQLQAGSGILNFIRLQSFCIKHCDELFYAKEKRSLLTCLRAAYFPVSCSYYCRYLSKTWRE